MSKKKKKHKQKQQHKEKQMPSAPGARLDTPKFVEAHWDKIIIILLLVIPVVYFSGFLSMNKMIAGSDYSRRLPGLRKSYHRISCLYSRSSWCSFSPDWACICI
jgi:hypothetical protein